MYWLSTSYNNHLLAFYSIQVTGGSIILCSYSCPILRGIWLSEYDPFLWKIPLQYVFYQYWHIISAHQPIIHDHIISHQTLLTTVGQEMRYWTKKPFGNFATMHKSTFSQNYFSHSSLEPRTSLCRPFAWLATRYLAKAPSIHRTAAASEPSCFCQSINSKAAIIALFGPNRYRHPQFTRLFRRQPVRWLLMADTAGRPPQTEANYVKHRLLLVKSPWQVTGRAGQSSLVLPKLSKIYPLFPLTPLLHPLFDSFKN